MSDTAGSRILQLLDEVMQRILDLQSEYTHQNTDPMVERGQLIRKSMRSILEDWLADEWTVNGRDGTGPKSKVPWVRVFDKSHSPSPSEGWYVV